MLTLLFNQIAARQYAGSGGIVFAGAAAASKDKVPQISGGITLGDAADVQEIHSVTASGGLTYADSATWSRAFVPQIGGLLTLSSGAIVSKGKSFAASGGLALAGSANTVPPVQAASYAYTATGGITFASSALSAFGKAPEKMPPSLLFSTEGSAREYLRQIARWISERQLPAKKKRRRSFRYAASGGLTISGSARIQFVSATIHKPETAGATLHAFMGAAETSYQRARFPFRVAASNVRPFRVARPKDEGTREERPAKIFRVK